MYSMRIGILIAALTAATFTTTHAEIRQATLQQPSTTSTPARLVDEQIAKVIAAAFDSGFRRVLADERGLMRNNGTEATFKVRLQEGVLYRIAARCDGDCSDIDLKVKDLSGRILKRDEDLDDTPAVDFRPTWMGDYIISLKLASASTSRTHVGAVVLSSQ